MTPKLTPTEADREMAADLLDLISDLLDHNGIGQVADLIRDGEYDEHEALQLVAQHAATARAEERERCDRICMCFPGLQRAIRSGEHA